MVNFGNAPLLVALVGNDDGDVDDDDDNEI
jgi:hypothetical protein